MLSARYQTGRLDHWRVDNIRRHYILFLAEVLVSLPTKTNLERSIAGLTNSQQFVLRKWIIDNKNFSTECKRECVREFNREFLIINSYRKKLETAARWLEKFQSKDDVYERKIKIINSQYETISRGHEKLTKSLENLADSCDDVDSIRSNVTKLLTPPNCEGECSVHCIFDFVGPQGRPSTSGLATTSDQITKKKNK